MTSDLAEPAWLWDSHWQFLRQKKKKKKIYFVSRQLYNWVIIICWSWGLARPRDVVGALVQSTFSDYTHCSRISWSLVVDRDLDQRDHPLVIYQYFLLYIYCIQLERVWPAQGLLDPRRGNLLHMTHNLAPDVQSDNYMEFVVYNTRTPASLALSITAWNLMRISSFIWWTLQQFWQKMRDPIPGKTFCYATVDVLSAKALTSCSKDCHLSHETSWGWCAT